MNLSVILPVWNEADKVAACLTLIRQSFLGEVIVVDGESDDKTVELARPLASSILRGPRGLATQCNRGASKAKGDWLFFLSADCQLPEDWLETLEKTFLSPYVIGGGFKLELDDPGIIFRFLSFGGNFRSRWDCIALGDQGLFVRREKYSEMREDSEVPFARLCFDLQRQGEFVLLPSPMKSSTRAYRKNGIWATTAQHISTYRRFKQFEFARPIGPKQSR